MSFEPTKDAESLFIASPIRWIDAGEDGDDGEMTALSVGTLDGKQRKERVAVLHALATRVATHSSNSRSQRTESTTLPSRPATSNGQPASQYGHVSNVQAVLQNGSAPMGQTTSRSHSVSNGHVIPQSQPTSLQPAPNTDLGAASLHDQPLPGSGPLQHPLVNGGPPKGKLQNINMPPPPTTMEQTKTDFFTPPSDPSEMKQLS